MKELIPTKIYFLTFVLLASIASMCNAQDLIKVDAIDVKLNSLITDELDSVNYAYLESSSPTNKTLVFIQGSGAIPLFCKADDRVIPMLPIDLTKVVNDWKVNLLLVAPPGVNCVEDSLSLDQNYYKVDTNGWPIMKYRQGNQLDLYVKRYTSVMNSIRRDNPSMEFYVFGHSQGSRVAAVLGQQNDDIKKIALASVNPLSRSHETISKIRLQELAGDITFERAQILIENEYKRVQILVGKEKKNLEEISEISFTYPSVLENMLQLNQPLRFIYGSRDLGTVMEADKLALSFIAKGKANFSTKVYPNMEHNFYEGENYNWDKVFADTVEWFFN